MFFKFINDHKKYVLFSYATIGINVLNGFILFPLILKYMGLKELGVFGIFFSMKSIIDIGLGWLSGSITKNLISQKDKKNSIVPFSFLINSFYGIIGCIIFIFYGYFFKNDYFCSSLLFGFFVLISFSTVAFHEVMISELRQYQSAFFKFLRQFLFFVFAITTLIIAEDKKLYLIFISLTLSSVVVFVLISIYYFKNFHEKFNFKAINRLLVKKLLVQDGSRFFINGVSTILMLQIDVLLLDFFYGSEIVGVYLILWKIPNTFIMLGWRLSDPFQAIVANKMGKNLFNEIKVEFLSLEKKIFGMALLAALGYIFLGRYVLEFWVGIDKVPIVKYMYVISAAVIIFSIMQRLYLSVNYYTKGLNVITILQFVEILFKIVFVILLFDEFGELSSIVGWMIAFIFTIFIYRWNSLRVIKNC